MLDIIQVFQGWRMVEDRWRFCNNLDPHKYVSIRIIQRNLCLRVEDGGTKRKKNSENVNSDLKVDHGL